MYQIFGLNQDLSQIFDDLSASSIHHKEKDKVVILSVEGIKINSFYFWYSKHFLMLTLRK